MPQLNKLRRKQARAEQLAQEKERKQHTAFYVDLVLLATVFLILGLFVFNFFYQMNVFYNLFFSIFTLFILLTIYFVGLIPGLALDFILLAATILGTAYEYIYHDRLYYGAFFWMLWPSLLCLACYALSATIERLQVENRQIRDQVASLATVDADTRLRTLDIFRDHFQVFSNIADDYHIPLYLLVVQVRYWQGTSAMLSKKERLLFIDIISDVIDNYENGHEFAYYIESNPPTWAILSTETKKQAEQYHTINEFRDHFKAYVAQRLAEYSELRQINLSLVLSYVRYDAKEHPDAAAFLEDGISELQYDV